MASQTLRDAALEYADAGWPIIRLRPQENRPLDKGGAGIATTDLAVVEAWWKETPRANIGFVPANRAVVLDVDTKNGATASPDWPLTRIARTPSGGTHHYYAHPGELIRGSIGKLAPGVDVIADGGSPWQVAVPPSRREDGAYEWINDEPLVSLSPELLDALREINTRRTGAGIAEPVELVAPGDMYDFLQDRVIRAVRAGMLDAGELSDFLMVSFERRRMPGVQYSGGPDDTRRLAEWAATSEIADDVRGWS
jgi:hypothetical protein